MSVLLMRMTLVTYALVMTILAHASWLGTTGLVLLACVAVQMRFCSLKKGWFLRWELAVAWPLVMIIPATFFWCDNVTFAPERYWPHFYAMLGSLILVPGWLLTQPGDKTLKPNWKGAVFACAGLGTLIWLVTEYLENQRLAFFVGLIVAVVWLVLWKASYDLRPFFIQLVNTVILIVIGVPVADLVVRRHGLLETEPTKLIQFRCYAAASRDPDGFERWWNYLGTQWPPLEKAIIERADTNDSAPTGLRPNSRGTYVESEIVINSNGFRGKEIPEPKGNAYRIVALGESTTFGFTMGADERPWPELLEQMIQDRLRPVRPIQVINAGVPGIDLPRNLRRLQREILPLKPDLVLCYHGYNCFAMLDKSLPRVVGKPPPEFCDRPVRLLADCEYRLKLSCYAYQLSKGRGAYLPPPVNLLGTDFAHALVNLIELTRTNGIRLAVGNFSMAANEYSPPEVVEFFRQIYPFTYRNIRANAALSKLVSQLKPLYPDVCIVDTHPRLDGEPEKFFDLIHFTSAGERQLAENFFVGIRPLLERELLSEGLEPSAAHSN